uniref:HMG box domain-containing protein n=1 Tax=Plectus sambesii TaxID=2011161 RepID=A0A914VBQ2_9BILA
MNEPENTPPKKVKANGFWSFVTSVRAQLELYNPAQVPSAITHAQNIWKLLSDDDKQEWEEFAREMDVRQRLCPEYVVDIVAAVRKQFDQDKKMKNTTSSLPANANCPQREEAKNASFAPLAYGAKMEGRFGQRNSSAIDAVGAKPRTAVVESPRSFDMRLESCGSPEDGLWQPAMSLKMKMEEAGSMTSSGKETSKGMDSRLGAGGGHRYERTPQSAKVQSPTADPSPYLEQQQHQLQYDNMTRAFSNMTVEPRNKAIKPTAASTVDVHSRLKGNMSSSATQEGAKLTDLSTPTGHFVAVEPSSNPWQRVVSITPQSASQQENSKSFFASHGPSSSSNCSDLDAFVRDVKKLSERQQPRITSTHSRDHAGDEHAQERLHSLVGAKVASSTEKIHHSSGVSPLDAKHSSTLPPPKTDEPSSSKAPAVQQQSKQSEHLKQRMKQPSPCDLMLPPPQRDRKLPSPISNTSLSAPKSANTLRNILMTPPLSASPIPTSETRMLGFGRGTSVRQSSPSLSRLE